MANKTTPIVQDIVFKMKADLGNMGAAMKQIASQLRAGEYNLGEKDVKKLITTVNRASTQIFRMGQTLDSTEDFSEKAFKAIYKDFTAISKLFGELPSRIDAVGLSFDELTGAYDPKKLTVFREELSRLAAEKNRLEGTGYKVGLLKNTVIPEAFPKGAKEIAENLGNEKALKRIYDKQLAVLEQHLAEAKAATIKAKKDEAKEITKIYDEALDTVSKMNFRTKEGKAAATGLLGYTDETAGEYTSKKSASRRIKQLRKQALDAANIDESANIQKAQAAENAAIAKIHQLEAALKILIATSVQYQTAIKNNGIQTAETEAKMESYRQEVVQAAQNGTALLTERVGEAATGMTSLNAKVEEFGTETASASKKAEVFENMQRYTAQVFGLASAMMALRRFFNKAVESIKELDEAFNQIAVVTNLTTNELWGSFEVYNTMAQQLGVRTVDAIRTSALYYQQGSVIHPINIKQ